MWHLTGDKMRALLIAGQVGQGVACAIVGVGFVAPGLISADRTFGALYLFLLALRHLVQRLARDHPGAGRRRRAHLNICLVRSGPP